MSNKRTLEELLTHASFWLESTKYCYFLETDDGVELLKVHKSKLSKPIKQNLLIYRASDYKTDEERELLNNVLYEQERNRKKSLRMLNSLIITKEPKEALLLK